MNHKAQTNISPASILVGKGRKKYPIIFSTCQDIPESTAPLTEAAQSVVVIADATAQALYPEIISRIRRRPGRRVSVLTLPGGERYKSGTQLLSLLESIISLGPDRSVTIVAFGGGVTTDMAGCVASLLLRGVSWIAIPTTFLGMIDAAIGGKTGVNSQQGKNLIGAFWPPKAVIISPDLIRTQPRIEFEDSLAEVAKYYAISGKPSLTALKKLQKSFPAHASDAALSIVKRCARIKARIVNADERESGIRAFLNFGHTIGHALEFCGRYRHISHGRAVAAGMVGAISLSVKSGLQITPAVSALEEYCRSLASGTRVTPEREEVRAALNYDKKRKGGKLMFVLLQEIGKPYLGEAPDRRKLNAAIELSIQALRNKRFQ